MDFNSDNVAGIAPEVMAAINEANRGAATPYGGDDWTARAEARLAEVFECKLDAFLVSTGTAANGLALAAMAPSHTTIHCHVNAHIATSENGAPEFYTGGAKLITLDGAGGKLAAADVTAHLEATQSAPNYIPRAALSVTQVTEAGTLYQVGEIAAMGEVARAHGLKLHMDGARFANAVAALDCTPADITWRAGVDVLSFGASKNGTLNAEAVIFFDAELARDFRFRQKQGGHVLSKTRFLGAQMEAYLADGRWLAQAAHANAMARRLGEGLGSVPGIQFRFPVEANILFVQLPAAMEAGLRADGFAFHVRTGVARLVTAFDTEGETVDAFIESARRNAP